MDTIKIQTHDLSCPRLRLKLFGYRTSGKKRPIVNESLLFVAFYFVCFNHIIKEVLQSTDLGTYNFVDLSNLNLKSFIT